jgi:hypothetical protein
MKTFSERAALLQKVRRALKKTFPKPEMAPCEDVAGQLLRLVLLEESTPEQVERAVATLGEVFVDLNELRVSLAR